MNEEDMQRILEDLADRGFNDDQLRREIENKEALGLPAFSIKRERKFEEERMFYRLFFQWTESILGFELTTIHANHRMPVDIDKKVVNGVNSIELDKQMSGIDWIKYWESMLKGQVAMDISAQAAGCIDNISQLLLYESPDVNLVGEQLMYKHWPPEVFALFSKAPEKIHGLYEHNFAFTLKSYADISADLAYLMISGRVDALEMQIADLGLPHMQESAVPSEIHKALKHLPGKQELKFAFATENYYASLSIPLKWNKGWYKVDEYELALTSFPEIESGTYNGIDSTRLDKKLGTVDWRNDEDIFFLASDNRSTFPRDIELLQEELFRMALSPEGKIVADQLMLKYWLCAPVFKDFINPSALELLSGLPMKTYTFSSDITFGKAKNLLLDRPVLEDKKEYQNTASNWLWLKPSKKGYQQLVVLPGISIKELQNLINVLPVDNFSKPDIEHGLITGDRVQTVAKSGAAFYVSVNDTATGIQLFDSDKKEIPFNFNMDANWTAVRDMYGNLCQQAPDAKEIGTKSKFERKHKGRRL
ncbi:hypothetical protein AB6805_13865 [Chitinophaga sp. RCC_12]|uniref:hypothetical protein n=1 Tax=Chitinophaga sp. RCC_12 TaxID=3239226 RepID=UPI00352419F3